MSGGRRFLDVPRGPPRYDGPPSAPSSTGAPGSARRPSNAGSNTGPPGSAHGAPSQAGSGRDRSPGRPGQSQGGSENRNRSPSHAGQSQHGSAGRERSPSGGQRGSQGGMEGPRMVDPARDPSTLPRKTDMARNVDLSAAAYLLNNEFESPIPFARRPAKGNTTGKEVSININSYPVLQFPNKIVYQYDVHIGGGAEKRAVILKAWDSKIRKEKVGTDFIFDGNKLAWSLTELRQEIRIVVDLDADQGGRAGRDGNTFPLTIRKTGTVNLAAIQAYFQGRISFDNSVLVAVNFLDHVLRESPSKNPQFTAIKRSFFTPNSQHVSVGGGVDAYKGVYQSMRLAQGGRLVLNLDVSNTCFWGTGGLIAQACNVLRCRDPQELTQKTRWVKNAAGNMQESEGFRNLRKLAKVRVKPDYRGCPVANKEFQIKSFTREDAKTYTIDIKDRGTGLSKSQTVFDYFRTKYNVVLLHWQLPLCQMTKKGVLYPMEVLTLTGHQRYPFKLDEDQTSKMIKFAVTLPNKRLEAIKEGQGWLNWQQDPVLAKFGLKVDPNMLKTKARVLPNPVIQFGGPGTTGQLNPGTTGRWDLKGKKFFSTNPEPLESWGVCVFNSGRFRLEQAQIGTFIEAFVKAYKGHGGQIKNEKPMMFVGPNDAGDAVEQAVNRTGNMFKKRPQILIFCVPDKNAFHYLRIKKSCDCRYGIVSQVMQNAQIQKCNPQYISNVLMKFNAKLGGCTSKALSKAGVVEFKVPTMIIGADVSHASPGSQAPSMAALTVSMDRHAGRYAAACETNGSRVEMVTESNIYSMLRPLFQHWQETVGGGRLPQHVYYFRDGVSEGQFQHVLQQEVPHMKKLMREMNPAWEGKFVVVVASKRHHIRFFPNPTDRNAADRNGNPLPGTLVEYDVTDPFQWDVYLNSHSAIQGTARPTHYHVLSDEIGLLPNQFLNMIYEHSYQYMRSTTPVSLFPAVYYAHLASNRARAHENVASSSGPQSGPGHQDAKAGSKGSKGSGSSDGPPTEHNKLLPMFNQTGIRNSMWYI